MKYGYVTKINSKWHSVRYRTWWEKFKDEDTGNFIKVKRHMAIKINGEKVIWLSRPKKK